MGTGLVGACKSMLTSAEWQEFEKLTGIPEAIQFLSRKLHVDSDDATKNKLLVRFQSKQKRKSLATIKTRIRDLKRSSRLKDFQSLTNDLTKEITAICQSDTENDRRLLVYLYCLRAEVHRRRHLRIFHSDKRQERTSFMNAIIDLESAHRCDPHNYNVARSKMRLSNAEKISSSIDSIEIIDNQKTSVTLPKNRLFRMVRKLDSISSSYSTSLSEGTTDSGTRSRSQSPAVGLRVCESPAKGRLLRATRSFRSGDEIYSECALAFAINPLYAFDRCNNCAKRITWTIHKCPRDCSVVYCSIRCYEQSESVHQIECPLLGIIISEHPHFQLNIRFFLLRNTDYGRKGADLIHHFGEYLPDQRFDVAVRSLYVSIALQQVKQLDIVQDMENGCPLMSIILKERCQIEMNSVSLAKRIGSALFPTFSLACHSCQPNVTYRSYGQRVRRDSSCNSAIRMHMYATEEIPNGTELTVSYTAEPDLEKRRLKLREGYLFDCSCSGCLMQMRRELPDSICTPVTACRSCTQELLSVPVGHKSSEDGLKIAEKFCTNDSCPLFEMTINFQTKKRFFSALLCDAISEMETRPSIENTVEILSKCTSAYNEFITLFTRPNILCLDYENFFCKLTFRLNYLVLSANWAEKGLETSRSLFGCHRETGLCFLRFVHIQSRLSNHSIAQTEQDILIRLNISEEWLQFFFEEISDGAELEHEEIMHFK